MSIPKGFFVHKGRLYKHGGPGSGHKGHKGRPGMVGGSDDDGLPSQEKILSEAERDYYYNTKSDAWVESPYDPKTSRDLKHEDLLKMDPEDIVTVKAYTAGKGGVARRKIKVKHLLLSNEPYVSNLPTLSKQYPTQSKLIAGLKAGERSAEITATSLISQVISGARLSVSGGSVDKVKLKEMNNLIRSMPDNINSLGGESYTNEFLIKKLEVAGRIYDIIKGSK